MEYFTHLNIRFLALRKKEFDDFLTVSKNFSGNNLEKVVNELYEDGRLLAETHPGSIPDVTYDFLFDSLHDVNPLKRLSYVNTDLEEWRSMIQKGEIIGPQQTHTILWYYLFKRCSYPFADFWYLDRYLHFSTRFLKILQNNPFFQSHNFVQEGVLTLGKFKKEIQLFGGQAAEFDMLVGEINKRYAKGYIKALDQSDKIPENVRAENDLWLDLLGKVIRDEIWFIAITSC